MFRAGHPPLLESGCSLVLHLYQPQTSQNVINYELRTVRPRHVTRVSLTGPPPLLESGGSSLPPLAAPAFPRALLLEKLLDAGVLALLLQVARAPKNTF